MPADPDAAPEAVEPRAKLATEMTYEEWQAARKELLANPRRAADAAEVERLTSENARLREALKFYADPEIYRPHPHGPAFERPDKSFVARTALGGAS